MYLKSQTKMKINSQNFFSLIFVEFMQLDSIAKYLNSKKKLHAYN